MVSFRAFQIWIARSESRGSQPPRSRFRFFALTQMDTDVEDEDDEGVVPEATHRSGARRLVIVGAQTQVDPVDPTALHEEWDRSDTESTESCGGTSDVVGEMEVEPLLEPPVPAVAVPVESFLDSFQLLAEVDLDVVFKHRPCLMKSVPGFLKGRIGLPCVLRLLKSIRDVPRRMQPGHYGAGSCSCCSLDFCWTSRPEVVWCQRSSCSTDSRCSNRDWAFFLIASMEHATRAAQASSRRSHRRDHDNLESRAARAEALVHMGELSAARQALGGEAAVAPGNRETLNALQNPVRRPPVLRDPIPQDILHVVPTEQFCLDFGAFTRNIRSARRGAASGPSGMTAEN